MRTQLSKGSVLAVGVALLFALGCQPSEETGSDRSGLTGDELSPPVRSDPLPESPRQSPSSQGMPPAAP